MAYRKGLVLSFGLVNVIVTLDGAVGKEESLTTVCCGPSGAEHAPTQISQVRKCSTCGEVSYGDLKKAEKVGADFRVVDQQEVAAVAEQALGATKKMLTLTVHDSAEVNTNTLQGESVYYVAPDGVAQVGAYSLLLDAVTRHPDKAFLTEYTPTSRASLWQLKAFQGSLVIEQRVWPEQVKAAPSTGAIEPDAGLQTQLDQVIGAMVKPFDPSAYRNDYAAALGQLLAGKEIVSGVTLERSKSEKTVATSGVVDLSATLAAMLGQQPTKTKASA
jgi:non-homologous end joining protein Ku